MFLKLSISIFILLSFSCISSAVPEADRDLVYAVGSDDIPAMRDALARGANANAVLGKNRVRPIEYVKSAEAGRILVEAGADPNPADFLGKRPLHFAPNIEVADFYLKMGVDVDVKDNAGRTPLYHLSSNTELANFLIEKGADVTIKDKYGSTLLFRGSIPIVRRALEAGVDPNAQNIDGKTALFYASPQKVRLLLEAGADATIQDNRGRVAYTADVESDANRISDLDRRERGCKYSSNLKKINNSQCGRRNLCIAEVSCKFYIDRKIGMKSAVLVTRTFQAICQSLENGECPSAQRCAIDTSVTEVDVLEESELSTQPQPTSGNSPPKNTSKAVR